jgi:hypothetical protein
MTWCCTTYRHVVVAWIGRRLPYAVTIFAVLADVEDQHTMNLHLFVKHLYNVDREGVRVCNCKRGLGDDYYTPSPSFLCADVEYQYMMNDYL